MGTIEPEPPVSLLPSISIAFVRKSQSPVNFNRKEVIIRHIVAVLTIAGMPLRDGDVATKVPQLGMPQDETTISSMLKFIPIWFIKPFAH